MTRTAATATAAAPRPGAPTPADVGRAVKAADGLGGFRVCPRCGHLAELPGRSRACLDCTTITIPGVKR